VRSVDVSKRSMEYGGQECLEDLDYRVLHGRGHGSSVGVVVEAHA